MEITKDIKYVGVNDHELDLFEGQYIVPNGMAYNSYVIIDDSVAVMDSVDARFGDEWLANIKNALDGRTPDYLVVSHMEPDHSANILKFKETYPNAVIVASGKAFTMMKNFYGNGFTDSRKVVADGDKLELGSHVLNFVAAPMVHWPEVIMSYDSTDKVLFSADAFGKFGALDADEDWACEARRYYFGIVGKYGAQVQSVLKKLLQLEVSVICPLHGPVLDKDLDYYTRLYNTWSSYGTESEGIVINYTSVYGNTENAVKYLAERLEALGCPKVAVNDLARCDMAEAVEDTFRYGKAVFASTTYNNDVFPFMKTFLQELAEKNYQNKIAAFIENGSWAPTAAKCMKAILEKSKNMTYLENQVTITSSVTDETKAKIEALAQELMSKGTL